MDNLTITAGDFVVEKKGKLRDNYRIGKKIGESLFGSVRKITHRMTGEVRTVKKFTKVTFKPTKKTKTSLMKSIFFDRSTIQM
jgi:hypothetical protein